ncbi:hypothetical protein [Actinacidiphila glaucinigra]|uniref:hypothetical protein n=1 Tax=Actinacidiphila glaucinigra TaxID=235986 RepID=UPI0029AE44EC|nr:hypothetical protein [Streptomyces sp. PA03-3a]
MRGGAARAAQRREAGGRPDAPDAGRAATGTAAGTWLVRGADGRLTAYAPCQGGLLRWTETAAGGDAWTGPDVLPADGLTHLAVTQGADAFVHFLGRRERPCADGGVAVDVVYALQYQTGRPPTEWVSVGNPHKQPGRAARLGAPAAAVDASGAVHVFVRNAGGGVMLRREGKGGAWEPWRDLRGTDVQEGLAPAAASSGRVEVLAAGAESALRWVRATPGGAMERASDILPAPVAGSVTALETAPDRLTWFWTDAGGSGIVAHRPGGWIYPLGGDPGDGAHAALRGTLDGYDCTVLAHRGRNGNAMIGAYLTESEGDGVAWTDTGVPCLGGPALAHDAFGRVVLAVIGRDGRPRLARQERDSGLTLSEWVRI